MTATNKSTQEKSFVLASFITLSLIAHGLLFVINANSQNIFVEPSSLGTQRLNITLASYDKNTSTFKKHSNQNKRQDTLQSNHENFTSNFSVIGKQTRLDSENNKLIPIEKINAQSTQTTAQRNFLLGELQHRLSHYLFYPKRARRQGLEGNVMIGLHVDEQGFLHNVRLTQTSGFSLLDNAALNAFGKVRNISLLPWLNKNQNNKFHPTSLQIPVNYQLIKS